MRSESELHTSIEYAFVDTFCPVLVSALIDEYTILNCGILIGRYFLEGNVWSYESTAPYHEQRGST